LENLITQPPLVSVSRVGPVIYLAHPNRLGTHDDNLVAMLTRVTGLYESRPFLIERSNGQWSTVTYGEFRDLVASTATRLARGRPSSVMPRWSMQNCGSFESLSTCGLSAAASA